MHGNQFQSAVDLAGCNCADGRPIFCLAWPRPFIVVGVIMAFAALLEALQGLTPDRTPDLPTALAAAAGALTAGVLAWLVILARKLALARSKQI